MTCNPLISPVCVVGKIIPTVTGVVAGNVLSGIAQAINSGVAWVVKNTVSWWVSIPSPDLATEPAVARLQQWILPITAAVAVAGVIAAGVRMVLRRRANPLIDVSGGLLTLALAATLGTVVPTLLLKAGDAWSTWVLQVSTGGEFSERLATVLTLGNGAAPAVVVIFGIVAIVFSIVQAALMLFRDAALIILAGVMPLAAAGSIAPMTRTWMRKVGSWMLALIFYKPAAAAVYATAFTLVGTGGSLQTVLMGFIMLVLSVIALPTLMKFFTWTTGTIATSGGGGQLLNAAAIGAVAVGTMSSRGGGSAPQDQAAYLNSRLGGTPGSSPPSGAPSSGPGGPPPSPAGWRPAPSGATTSAPGSSSAAASATPSGATFTAGSAASSAASTDAGGAAAAGAGPVGAATVAATQVASAGKRMATGAMDPEDQS
jgi:hypothetical protein